MACKSWGNWTGRWSFCWVWARHIKNGNLFISGSFSGSCNFVSSNGNIFTTRSSVSGSDDIFTAKLNNNGIFQWVANSGGVGWDEAGSICIDDSENVYTTGFYTGSVTFNSSGGTPNLSRTGLGSTDAFVTKHSATGTLVYATTFGSTSQDMGTNLRADKFGNLYLTGIFSCCAGGPATLGNYVINNSGSWGGFISKLNNLGQFVWVNHIGSSADEAFINLEIDHENHFIYGVGHFNGATTLTSRPPFTSVNLTPNGGSDILVAKFDTSGGLRWANKYGGTGNDIGWGIDVGNDGNIVFGAEYGSTFAFGSTNMLATGSMNVIAGKVNATNGNPILGGRVSGNGGSFCRGMSHNKSGQVIITGYFTQTTNAGPNVLVSAGAEDAFIASFQFTDTTLLITNKTNLNCNDSARLSVPNKTRDQFRWFRNDTLVTVTDSNFLFIKVPGTYKVVNINNCATPDTSNTVVITSSAITLNVGPPITACNSDSIQINITSTASQYSWTPAAIFNNPTLKNPKLKMPASGKIYVTATSPSCTLTDSIAITVLTPTVGAGLDTSVCLGDSVRLNGTASGATSVNWTQNYRIIQANTLTPTVFPLVDTNYVITAVISGCTVRDTIRVVVKSTPNVIASADIAICRGDTANLNVSGANSYTWWPATNISNTSIQSPKTYPISSQYYYVRGTTNGCSAIDSVLVSVTVVNINAGADSLLCLGDSIRLNATTNGTSFAWLTNFNIESLNSLTPKVWPNKDTLYVLQASIGSCQNYDTIRLSLTSAPAVDAGTDRDICTGATLTLNANGANTYAWWPNIAINDTTLKSPIVSTQTSRYYYVRGYVGTCSAIDSIWINYIPVNANAGNDTLVCPGDTITLNGFVDPNIGSWWPNYRIDNINLLKAKVWPLKDTFYVISAINGSCVAKDTVRILHRVLPSLDAGADKQICLGDTVLLTATGANFYTWLSNYNITSVNNSNTRVFPLIDTAYVVEGLNDVCHVYDTVLVKVLPYPTVDAGEDITICDYETTQLQGVVNNNSSFTWLSSASLSDIKVLDPIAFPSQTTSYFLTANNQQCASSDTVTVWVSTLLNAAISANPIKGIVPLNVNFTNQSSNTGKTFWWTFGDGNSGNTRDIQHIFNVIGKYTTQMVVADSNGCLDTANIQIEVLGEENIWVPNVFTPQGDSINDVFKPVYIGTFEYIELRVYSRWGELLHIARVPGENWWNGTYKGSECPDGVYVFILLAKGGSGKNYEFNGTVTLLR